MEHPQEREQVRQARAGDRKAFAELVERYWPRVHRFLYGLTGNPHASEDLTQDVFVRAWSALPELLDDGRFRPWLFRIARNLLLDSRRGPRSVRPQPLPPTLTTAETGPEATALEREGERLLRQATARLPVAYRAAYLLWTQEGLPYAEIAQALAVTEETARWRVCKARQILVKELEAYLNPRSP